MIVIIMIIIIGIIIITIIVRIITIIVVIIRRIIKIIIIIIHYNYYGKIEYELIMLTNFLILVLHVDLLQAHKRVLHGSGELWAYHLSSRAKTRKPRGGGFQGP